MKFQKRKFHKYSKLERKIDQSKAFLKDNNNLIR